MILPQPKKQEIHTFFDIVNLLAGFEHANYQKTGFDLFPGIPRPTPEVQKVMAWLHSIIMEEEVSPIKKEVQISKTNILIEEKKRPVPWNKGLKKDKTAVPSSKAAKMVGKAAEPVGGAKVPSPEELPPTILKPGKPFDYASEVPDLPILVDNK